MSDFDFRPIDLSPAGIAQACELLRLVFPTATHITPDYLARLYFGNPLGIDPRRIPPPSALAGATLSGRMP